MKTEVAAHFILKSAFVWRDKTGRIVEEELDGLPVNSSCTFMDLIFLWTLYSFDIFQNGDASSQNRLQIPGNKTCLDVNVTAEKTNKLLSC